MSKQPKTKTTKGTRNDARNNGKAAKTNPGRRHKGAPVTELEKILMGQGLHRKWRAVLDGKAKGLPERAKSDA